MPRQIHSRGHTTRCKDQWAPGENILLSYAFVYCCCCFAWQGHALANKVLALYWQSQCRRLDDFSFLIISVSFFCCCLISLSSQFNKSSFSKSLINLRSNDS